MTTDGYASFLSAMGHDVRVINDTYWFDVHPHIYTSFPFHHTLPVSTIDIKQVLKRDGWALRYACPSDEGRDSYLLGCDCENYDLSTLSGKARNQTRRGLEQCSVKKITFSELEKPGLVLNRDTLERQGRTIPSDFNAYWQKYYMQAAQSEGAEAWGCYVDDKLAAYLIAFEMDNCANILIVRSSREYLKAYPNNALLFTYLEKTLRRSDVNLISIGQESLQLDMSGLDRFKLGMGFKKIPIGQRIELTPWMSPWLKGSVLKGVQQLARLRKNDERFAKLAGMLEWYGTQPK